MSRRSPFGPRRHVDVRTISLAVMLLSGLGIWWLLLSHSANRERARIRAHVPAFPQRRAPPAAPAPAPPPATVASAPQPRDIVASQRTASPVMQRFLLNNQHAEVSGMVHLNTLLNAPFIHKLNRCFEERELERIADGGSGFQPQRDIDELSFTDEGTLVTGSFDGTPESAGFHCQQSDPPESYRGFTIYHCGSHSTYAGQQGAILEGGQNIRKLIDQATDPPPAGADPGDIYGDMYWRLETSDLGPTPNASTAETLVDAALKQLTNVRIRANVGESVALSAEARPGGDQTAQDAATSIQGVLGAIRSQINENDVELSTFAELAQVSSDGGRVYLNLALPPDMLADKLNRICAESQRKRANRVPDPEPEPEPVQEDGTTEESPETK
jgi:hypothetical protein